ncbi:unnamed protein product [Ectocarpus sp. 8 AP-2014]
MEHFAKWIQSTSYATDFQRKETIGRERAGERERERSAGKETGVLLHTQQLSPRVGHQGSRRQGGGDRQGRRRVDGINIIIL